MAESKEPKYIFRTVLAPPSVAGLGFIDVCLTCGCEVPGDYRQMHIDYHNRIVEILRKLDER